jgi:predicted phosphodiesterase
MFSTSSVFWQGRDVLSVKMANIMKITLVSDLHLEFSPITLVNVQQSDVLILSGDIMLAQYLHEYPVNYPVPTSDRYQLAASFRNFLKNVSEQFENVIYVAGNHEFYYGKWYAAIDYLREEIVNYPNIHFLENDSVKIDDVVFVGGTLWTDCNKEDELTMYHLKDRIEDYNLIRDDKYSYRKIKPIDTIIRHTRTLEYIKTVILNVRESNSKVVVVGHHAPSHLSILERYAHEHLMNGGYYSDLSEFILDHPEIVLWTHGHMHHTFDYNIGDCRIVCNPRGYENSKYNEYTGWDPNLVIEI